MVRSTPYGKSITPCDGRNQYVMLGGLYVLRPSKPDVENSGPRPHDVKLCRVRHFFVDFAASYQFMGKL